MKGFQSESDTHFSVRKSYPLFSISSSSRTAHLSPPQSGKPPANFTKMSEKQTQLESFFDKRERPSDETAKDSKIANKKESSFKIQYRELYLNYGFIATHICGNQLSNKLKWLHSMPNLIYGGDK